MNIEIIFRHGDPWEVVQRYGFDGLVKLKNLMTDYEVITYI